MSPSDAPTRRRVDAYFAASVEVARRLAEGRGSEAIAVLRAEWQYSAKPDRVQALADRHLPDLQPGAIQQIARWSEIVARPVPVDSIGKKLEALGLGEPTNTPTASRSDARTPTTTGSIGRKP